MRLLVFTLLLSCSSPQTNKLISFSTDGCSLYPNGTWLHCCLAHDMNYWIGGEKSEKDEADRELNQCLTKNGSSLNAKVMTRGVHLGGGANNVLPWAWGYGWKKNPGYSKLTKKQLEEIKEKMDSIVPGVREYESQLSKKQLEYVLGHYQKLLMKVSQDLQK